MGLGEAVKMGESGTFGAKRISNVLRQYFTKNRFDIFLFLKKRMKMLRWRATGFGSLIVYIHKLGGIIN